MSEDHSPSRRPLVITDDPILLDDVLRLAAAADVEVEVAHAVAHARPSWSNAPLILIGADLARDLARSEPARHPEVVLIGSDPDDEDVWRHAVAIGARQVVFLPAAETWLADRLADAAEGRGTVAATVCVVGGRGGAGATTLAAALAVTGMRSGQRTLLVDGDPLGGGIDLVLGGEGASGSRWGDLAGTRGRVSGIALHGALPRVDELTVLSWDRGDTLVVPVEAMRSVLAAAQRSNDLVVVDLPRRLEESTEEALARSTVALLVVPAEVRAAVSAARVAASVARHTADLRVVVRGPAPSGLSGHVIAESLGLPLAGEMRAEPGLARALDRGEPPARHGRGPLADFCSSLLTDVRQCEAA